MEGVSKKLVMAKDNALYVCENQCKRQIKRSCTDDQGCEIHRLTLLKTTTLMRPFLFSSFIFRHHLLAQH